MKLDISDETLGHFTAAFVETKPGILSIMLVAVNQMLLMRHWDISCRLNGNKTVWKMFPFVLVVI